MKTLMLFLLVVFSFSGFGLENDPLVQFVGKPTSNISGIPVYEEATVTIEGEAPKTVYLTGAGKYRQRVLFSDLEVYVITSYSIDPNGVSPSDPLSSLAATELEMVQMTMLRDVSQSQARGHFEDAFVINGVDINEPETRRLLDAIPAQGVQDVTTIVAVGPNDAEELIIEYPNETLIGSMGRDRALDQWKSWFGKPLNANMEKVKKQLMGIDFSPAEWFF